MKQKLQELMAKGISNEEIITALTNDGHNVDEITKALAEQGVSEEDMQKALDLLDDLTKSDDGDDLDVLIKALEEEEALLQKSDDNDEDDEGGDDDENADDDDLEKSFGDDSLDELIKASEMYAEMTDEVRKSHGDIMARMNAMDRMILAQSNLLIKSAQTIAAMAKSLDDMAGAPAAVSRSVLGLGKEVVDETAPTNSVVQAALFKAVQEKRIEPLFMSTFAVRGLAGLPENVRKEIGY